MNFTLTGFTQTNTIRKFVFACIAEDRSRTTTVVSADLTLLHKYAIKVQELPLLCRRLLEANCESGVPAAMTFSESEMERIKSAVQEAAAERKPRRPRSNVSDLTGHAWRHAPPGVEPTPGSAAPGFHFPAHFPGILLG